MVAPMRPGSRHNWSPKAIVADQHQLLDPHRQPDTFADTKSNQMDSRRLSSAFSPAADKDSLRDPVCDTNFVSSRTTSTTLEHQHRHQNQQYDHLYNYNYQQQPSSKRTTTATTTTITTTTAKTKTNFNENNHQHQPTKSTTAKGNFYLFSLATLLRLTTALVVVLALHHQLPVDGLRVQIGLRGDSAHLQRSKRAVTSQTGNGGKLLDVDAIGYLQRYGYMNLTNVNANLISEDSFHDAISQFQRFAGIPETGHVDSLTFKYMQMPRCGNKDQSGKTGAESGRRKRRKRYALQGSKWRRQELTYRISQYPTKFANKKHEVDRQIEKAFRIWSQVAPIDFVQKRAADGRVHIDIRFANGEHGDGDPFDGPGNTLAHAYFPQYGGDAHFDDQEFWTVDSYAGTNIFQVAAHELGHSLGLGHSSVREALMAPFYQKYKPNFKLHADDVLAIQALYGERQAGDEGASSSTSSTSTTTSSTSPSSTTPPSSSSSDSFTPRSLPKPADLCQDATIDAITRTEDGSTYAFRGHYYWLITNDGVAAGYPGKISRDWDGLPANLDAALTWSDGKTFFFKGDSYWRYHNKRRESGYPKLIKDGFAGIPNDIDAAFVWSGNGKTYFFKRDKYWRYESRQDPPVSSQYPKSIKNWTGLPASGIDAAFKWENGMTYFFKRDQYYRFDDREFEVDSSARPSFPRPSGEWWFGCTNSNLAIRRQPGAGTDKVTPTQSIWSSSRRSSFNSNQENNISGSQQDQDSQESRPSSSSSSPSSSSTESLTRSILNSLSSLLPSSLTSSSSSSSALTQPNPSSASRSNLVDDDWSFHQGLGEEVRRLLRSATRAPTTYHANQRPRGHDRASDGASRWHFPILESSRPSDREQSMSELRMAPENSTSTSTEDNSENEGSRK